VNNSLAVAVFAAAFAILPNVARAAEPVEFGPCGEDDAIVVTVPGAVKACAYALDTNGECDANDVVVHVGSRTYCVRVP
jgi:hypothetical protein